MPALKTMIYFFKVANSMKYVYWTGGFDSTFIICYRLLVEKCEVQPIYLSYKLDNSKNASYYRKSTAIEKDIMDNIRRELNKTYPETIELLKPTIYVDESIYDPVFERMFAKPEMIFKRPQNQYKEMAKYAHHFNNKIEVGSMKVFYKNNYGRYLDTHERKEGEYYVLPDDSPLHNLIYPIRDYTKKDMYKIAKDNGFAYLLHMTWSCWFPRNGTPCYRCPMCRDRVIPQPICVTPK